MLASMRRADTSWRRCQLVSAGVAGPWVTRSGHVVIHHRFPRTPPTPSWSRACTARPRPLLATYTLNRQECRGIPNYFWNATAFLGGDWGQTL